MNLRQTTRSNVRQRTNRLRFRSLAVAAGAIVASGVLIGSTDAQVHVDGKEIGQTIQGYANRGAYTSRARIATRRVATSKPTDSQAELYRSVEPGPVFASLDSTRSSSVPYEFQHAQALRAVGYTSVDSNTSTGSGDVEQTAYSRPFVVDPWYQKRYEAHHPDRYYRGLYRSRYYYGSGYGYTYYPYYRYRYSYPYSYYYRPYYSSYGWWYPSFSFYYGSRSDCRPSRSYRTNNWFDGYRYHRQVIYDGRSSRYGYRYHGSNGLSLHIRF